MGVSGVLTSCVPGELSFQLHRDVSARIRILDVVRLRTKLTTAIGVALMGATAWGEWVSWRASRSLLGVRPVPATDGTAEVVVVFGYRNRSPERANALNRWRVESALRSVDSIGDARLVFCGGDPTGVGVSESELLARYAQRELGWRGKATLESESESTWENVVNAVPLIQDADRIVFVSDPLHGMKARLYLHAIRPDLAARLVKAKDYRFGEWSFLKPFAAVYGLRALKQAEVIAARGGLAEAP